MNPKYSFGIVVHGDLQTGYGHVSRCLTVADEFLRHGHSVVFLIKNGFSFHRELQSSAARVVLLPDWQQENLGPELTELDAVIIDVVGSEYQRLSWITKFYTELLLVTITLFAFERLERFEHLSFFPNPAVPNEKKMLRNSAGEILVLCQGPMFLTFRQEFAALQKTIQKKATKLLLTMGGSDPFNLTLQSIKAIESIPVEITIVLSSICQTYAQVYECAQQRQQRELPTKLLEKVDDMALLMLQSDVIFLNGGLSRYEACMAQTPFIAVSIHEQQFAITQQLADLGVCVNLGVSTQLDSSLILIETAELLQNYKRRLVMSKKMKKLFDMDGAKRIYNEIIQTIKNFSQ